MPSGERRLRRCYFLPRQTVGTSPSRIEVFQIVVCRAVDPADQQQGPGRIIAGQLGESAVARKVVGDFPAGLPGMQIRRAGENVLAVLFYDGRKACVLHAQYTMHERKEVGPYPRRSKGRQPGKSLPLFSSVLLKISAQATYSPFKRRQLSPVDPYIGGIINHNITIQDRVYILLRYERQRYGCPCIS